MNLHVTPRASGYFQNVWVWTADHDLDYGTRQQINVLSDRGVLIEAREGPVWMYGTASEHQLLYQYSLVGCRNVLLAMIQTETPYFQGHRFTPASQSVQRSVAFHDPDCARDYASDGGRQFDSAMDDRAFGIVLDGCTDVYVLGAGLYSFFDNYAQDTLPAHACQRRLCVLDDENASRETWLVNVATVGCEVQLTHAGRDVCEERTYREGFCSTLPICKVGVAGPQHASAEIVSLPRD